MGKINQLESLRVLKKVMESGSFTGAAKQLDLSVARVSKSIDRLEAELSTKLFVRSTRHLQPTENATRCYQYAIKMLEHWDSLKEEVTDEQFEARGKIKIGVPMSWGLEVFSPIATKFAVQYPDITLDIVMTDQFVNVFEGEYDLVLRLARQLEDSTLLCKRLASYKFVVCASPLYLKDHGEPQSPETLANHKCLVFSQDGTSTKWLFSRKNKAMNIHVDAHLKSNNSLLLKDALLSHTGVAVLPEFIVSRYINSGQLQQIFNDYSTKELNLYSLRPANLLIPRRLQLFNQFLADELALRE